MTSVDKAIYITGPKPSLELVYNDVWLPGLYSRRILCFELPKHSNHDGVIDVIRRGLQALVQGTPELGAKSIVVPDAAPHDSSLPWRALIEGDGISLVIKDMRKTFPSYGELAEAGFALSWLKDSLFMPVPAAIMPEPQPQASFQLSLIEGGALLSVCIYHHLTDGNGMNTITRALGEECKKAGMTEGSLAPRVLDVDRSVMQSLRSDKPDLQEHRAYEHSPGIMTPAAKRGEASSEADHEPVSPAPRFKPGFYHITDEKAQALKGYASRDTAVSTHDAIIAMLWRTLILARLKNGQLQESDMSSFTMPHDARRHVGLAKDWVGNCTYFILAEIAVSDIVKPDSVPMIAAAIRAELNKVNRKAVEDLMTLRRQDPYGLSLWLLFKTNDANVLAATSMYHSDIMGHDWGSALGEVKHFTSTDLGPSPTGFRRMHFVGPKLDGGRGCNVHVGLLEEEVETFSNDALWCEYFRLLGVPEDIKTR